MRSVTQKSRNALALTAGKGVKNNVKNFINNIYLSIKLLKSLVYWCQAYNTPFKKSYHWVIYSKPFQRQNVQEVMQRTILTIYENSEVKYFEN
jgi:hypothetical protein